MDRFDARLIMAERERQGVFRPMIESEGQRLDAEIIAVEKLGATFSRFGR